MLEDIKYNMLKRKFSSDLKVRKMLYEKLGSLVRNGMSMKQIVSKFIERADAKNKKTAEVMFLRHVKATMEEGKDFSESLKGWASPNEVLIIASGEQSGSLESAFKSCSELLGKIIRMKKTIVSASIYPSILFIALFLVIFLFAKYMIPILNDLSPREDWGEMERNLAVFSEGVVNNIVGIIIFVVGLFFIVKKSLGNFTGTFRDKYLDKIPPYSLYKEIQAGLFLVSVSTLMNAGMPFNYVLSFIEEESPKYLKNKVAEISEKLADGVNEGVALNTDFIGEIGDDIEDFADGSGISVALDRMGSEVVDAKIEKIEKSSGLLKTIAMSCVFIYILWAYFSFMGITQSIKVGQ